jgi:hypothetical protein
MYESNPNAISPPPPGNPGNLTFEKIINWSNARPNRQKTTVKCPAIGVVLVLEFWLKLNLTSISRLKRTKNRLGSSSFCSTGHIVSYIYD